MNHSLLKTILRNSSMNIKKWKLMSYGFIYHLLVLASIDLYIVSAMLLN